MQWLEEESACKDGQAWFVKNKQEGKEAVKVFEKLIRVKQLSWANWGIVRVMTRPQYIAYAIFAAEQVINIYEKKYPNNKRPREAIEAAKAVLQNDTKPHKINLTRRQYPVTLGW